LEERGLIVGRDKVEELPERTAQASGAPDFRAG
jgi:hypothetical protein